MDIYLTDVSGETRERGAEDEGLQDVTAAHDFRKFQEKATGQSDKNVERDTVRLSKGIILVRREDFHRRVSIQQPKRSGLRQEYRTYL